MTKEQLIEALEDVSDDCEIRLMTQSSYPFEYNVLGTWTPKADQHSQKVLEQEDGSMLCSKCLYDDPAKIHDEALGWEDGECDRRDDDFVPRADKEASKLEVLYLVEGAQLAYGSEAAFDDCERC